MSTATPARRALSALAFFAAMATIPLAHGAPPQGEKAPEKGEQGAAGDSGSAVGPGRGAGERRVVTERPGPTKAAGPKKPAEKAAKPAEKAEKPAVPPRPKKAKQGEKPAKPAHQKGRPPRKPRPTMPKGAPRAEPNAQARRLVVGGATAEEKRAGKDDPQLRALREAERVLFPRPLEGATPGWSWDLPRPVESGKPQAVTSGVPPEASLRLPAGTADVSAADAEWLRSLTMPNLPVRLDARVVKYLRFYRDSAKGKAIIRVWAKKSGRFTPALKAEFAKAGLPTDLVWLSLIESGHNPSIVSPAGAGGLWQFIPDTARVYGLTVDRWVDERFDPRRATETAIRLLSDLYQRYGNWELAMAAYNMGHGGLSRAIRKFNTNDFWELSRHEAGIPWETALYVPKIFAIALVMNNRRAFGIDHIKPAAPERFDIVRVGSGVLLSRVAAAAEVSVSVLQDLNPHLLASRTPPSTTHTRQLKWPVRVPLGLGVVASQRLGQKSGPGSELEPYVVRFGDTVSAIATSYRTSVKRLQRINGLDSSETLHQNTVLLVPRLAPGERGSGSAHDEVVVVPSRHFQYTDRERVFYRVRSGDTTGEVATAFGVTPAELAAWNALDDSARLQPDMVLQVFVKDSTRLDRVRHTKERETRVLVAGSTEFFDYFEGRKGKKRMLVTVQKGDSLRSLGKRYGMSIGWMERVNRRSRRDKLTPGETVVVYVPRGTVVPNATTGAGPVTKPLPAVDPPKPEALPPLSDQQSNTAAFPDS